MVFKGHRVEEVLAIYHPVPTIRTPMRIRCPVVYLVGFASNWLVFTIQILTSWLDVETESWK